MFFSTTCLYVVRTGLEVYRGMNEETLEKKTKTEKDNSGLVKEV